MPAIDAALYAAACFIFLLLITNIRHAAAYCLPLTPPLMLQRAAACYAMFC